MAYSTVKTCFSNKILIAASLHSSIPDIGQTL